jgi:hypothetical protein
MIHSTPGVFSCCLFFLSAGFILSSSAQESVTMNLSVQQELPVDWFGYNGQNVIRSSSWADSSLLANLPLLKPKTLRYPSGFAFWDWKQGWFVDSPLLPSKYATLDPQPNYLENFKEALDKTGADALFTLNIVTATLQDQLDMLRHADQIGIPVKYVELGSEVNLAPNDEDSEEGMWVQDSIYPTARAYAMVVNEWVDSIHYHFPQAKVCINGSYEKGGSGKSGTWNDSIRPLLSGREDAWSFHVYQPAGWTDSTETDADLANVTYDEVPDWMIQPYKAMNTLIKSLNKMSAGKEAWITEYNMGDHFRPVQGMWGHGLYNGLMTLEFLRDQRVEHIFCHAMCGASLYGQYFTDSSGFILSPDDDLFPTISDPPNSSPWALTASGHVTKSISLAAEGKKAYCRLNFDPLPEEMIVEAFGRDTFFLEGIQGYLFVGDFSSNAIIMNLTASGYSVSTASLFPSGSTYIMKYADPLTLVANNDSVNIESGGLPTVIELRPYSILRIQSNFKPLAAPLVEIDAPDSSAICEGDSLWLDAGPGYLSYEWSTGETSQGIWAKEGGDYFVNVVSNAKAYAGADSVYITINELPVQPRTVWDGPNVFCDGRTTGLSLYEPAPEGITYQWNTGETDPSITMDTSGIFWVTFTNSFGCARQSIPDTVVTYPVPDAYITASGNTTFCDGGSVTLTAYPAGETYEWSNGKKTQSISVTADGNFFVSVTNEFDCKETSDPMLVTEVTLPNPTVSAVGPATYCDGSASTYLKTIDNYSYQWKKGSTSLSGATLQTYTPVSTGNYKVTITDANGCTKTSSAAKSITINSVPNATVTSSVTNICGTETALLSANTGSGLAYQWKKNNLNIGGATNSTYTATKAAEYACRVTKSSTGCSATSSPVNITSICRAEEDANTRARLDIFPNPADDWVNIVVWLPVDFSGEGTLQAWNAMGKSVYWNSMRFIGGRAEITLHRNEVPQAGVYFIHAAAGRFSASDMLVIQ